jgi:hypothetical protein
MEDSLPTDAPSVLFGYSSYHIFPGTMERVPVCAAVILFNAFARHETFLLCWEL